MFRDRDRDRDKDRITTAELAEALDVSLALPDAVAKALYERPVAELTPRQLARVVELLSTGEWVSVI